MTPPAAPFAEAMHQVSAQPRYLCHCLKVTHDEVRHAVDYRGCDSVDDVTASCGAGGGCTACHRRIRALLGGS